MKVRVITFIRSDEGEDDDKDKDEGEGMSK